MQTTPPPPLTDASIRDNATMLLKELKTKDAGR